MSIRLCVCIQCVHGAASRVTQCVLGNSLTTNYTYYPWTTANGQGRLQNISTGSLQNMSYTYDAVGNVMSIVGPDTQSFTYDELDRLKTVRNAYTQDFDYNAIGNLNPSLRTYGTQSSGCPDGALTKPHAVVISGTNTYCYDPNGNMVRRVAGSTYNLGYDTENRLTSVSGGASATFVYDGDGNRVKGTVGSTTTYYVGNYYELSGSTTRKYYYAGSQRVAMTENGTVYYLLSDHLGSTAVTANNTGGWNGEVRYYAFGGTRYNQGTSPTTYRYTGQRQESALGGADGLYFYNARWYDPYLGRFLSADTLVPSPGDPQGLNRYAYTLNNPVKYTHPTGHAFLSHSHAPRGNVGLTRTARIGFAAAPHKRM
jgi:RHS repeat-associated protein